MDIRAIITGATGMVGEGVLHECLHDPAIEQILLLSRRASGVQDDRVKEIILPDMQNLATIEGQLTGYDACFFCLGVSSVGIAKAEYERLTYDLTLQVAQTLGRLNPAMTFCYVSGAGTDSTERGRSHWARTKGRTENALLKLPFRQAFMFRLGYLHPTPGLRNTLPYYRYFTWLYPVLRRLFPNTASTLRELGQAMIQVALHGSGQSVLGVRAIVRLARARGTA